MEQVGKERFYKRWAPLVLSLVLTDLTVESVSTLIPRFTKLKELTICSITNTIIDEQAIGSIPNGLELLELSKGDNMYCSISWSH